MSEAARVLDALGDPTRRAVFEHLRDRPLPVVELASRLPVSRPAVSRHLRVLESAGLVRGRAVGRNRLYSVDRTGLHAVQLWLTTFWDDVLTSFADHVESGPVEDGDPEAGQVEPGTAASRAAASKGAESGQRAELSQRSG